MPQENNDVQSITLCTGDQSTGNVKSSLAPTPIDSEEFNGLITQVNNAGSLQNRYLNQIKTISPHEPEIYGLIAIGSDGAFGLGSGLPWHNPNDMKWFKEVTMGNNVVVSQKTLDTIPNGLPGRIIFLSHRDKIVSRQGWPLNFDYLKRDTFFIGGKQAIKNYMEYFDGFYVTIIPGEHKHDVKFDIDDIYLNGFQLDYIGESKEQKNRCYLLAFSKKTPLARHEHPIKKFFEPFLKLTLEKDIIIKPGAHGIAEINEMVFTPRGQVGIFDVRKKLGDAGLYTTGITFKRGWYGVPTITITNKSESEMHLHKGDEIGEISFVNNQSI